MASLRKDNPASVCNNQQGRMTMSSDMKDSDNKQNGERTDEESERLNQDIDVTPGASQRPTVQIRAMG